MNRYQIITLANLPDLIYEGYYWSSDEKKPDLLDQKKVDASIFTSLPFIIEANFFAPAEKVSIQVKNIDGAYQIARIDLTEQEIKAATVYLGHDLKGRNFKLVEAWEEVQDDLLEGMKTLQPAWSAFAGFTN